MNHPLEKKIRHLRGRLWWLAMARAVGWLVVAALGGAGVLGAIDYWIRFKDPGMRVILTLALLGLLGWVCYRFFYRRFLNRQWRKRLSAVRLSQRVQRTFPQLGDSLASSVEFLQQPEDDPRAGSATLRRAVVAATTAKTDGLKFTDSIDARPALRAVVAAVAMCLLAATAVALDPLWVQVAVARLAYPLGDVRWPQKTYLDLVDRVERVAAGGPFEVEVVDAFDAKLPADAKIFYRFEEPDGSIKEENEPMRHLGRVLRARRENVTRPFSYRIIGGDDRSMEWIAVEIVEPPSVETLALRLTPPQYTAWPPATIDESQAAGFRAMAGTRVRMEATVNKPLESVELRLGKEQTVAGTVSGDGMRFVVPGEKADAKSDEDGFVVERSGAFWFELTDRQGLKGGEDLRWDIRVIEDRAPTVLIERPTGTVYATPRATVPLRVLVKDDLAIRRVTLVVRLENGTNKNDMGENNQGETDKRTGDERRIVLFEGPDQPEPRDSAAAEMGESRAIDYRWELDGFNVRGQWLKPGSKVVFYVVGEDYQPRKNKSAARRLVVITPREMAARIAARQEFILAELARVLKMQRQSRGRIDGLVIRLEETGRLGAAGLDNLRRAELGQREAAKSLAGREDGVHAHIERLLRSLENNRLDSPELRRRMGGLLDKIDRLRNGNFAVIATEMTAAVKSAQACDKAEQPDKPTLDALRIVGRNQATAVKTLERMLGRLSQWDNYRRFHREVGQLIRKQENLLRRSVELGRKTLSKSPSDLKPQEAAELRIAAHDEAELARWLDRIVQGMSQTAAKLGSDNPLAAETLGDAMHCINQRSIAARMRSADDNLRQNHIAQAIAGQRRVVEDLQEVLDILANRRQRELVRLVKRLREAEAKLAELAAKQDDLGDRFDKMSKEPSATQKQQQLERLAAEQKSLEEDTLRTGRRLERLLARRASEEAAHAGRSMGKAADNAQKTDAKAAKQDSDDAKKDLQKAADSLAQRRRQAEAELATEKMAGLVDALVGLKRRQEKATEETIRLDALQRASTRDGAALSQGQLASLGSLAREQTVLAQDTGVLAEKSAAAGVFQLALSTAAAKMEVAAGRLARRQTGNETQARQRDAERRLGQILDALKSAKDEQKKSGSGGADGKGGQPGGGQGQEVKLLAQLKLFKMLQREINDQTQTLEQKFGGKMTAPDSLPERVRRAYAELAEEQRRLAERMLQLLPEN